MNENVTFNFNEKKTKLCINIKLITLLNNNKDLTEVWQILNLLIQTQLKPQRNVLMCCNALMKQQWLNIKLQYNWNFCFGELKLLGRYQISRKNYDTKNKKELFVAIFLWLFINLFLKQLKATVIIYFKLWIWTLDGTIQATNVNYAQQHKLKHLINFVLIKKIK